MVGDLGHRRPRALLAVLAEGGLPAVFVEGDPADRRMDAGIAAGHDGEADVAGPGVPHEVGAPGGVGAHLDRAAHQRRVVAATVTDSDFGRQP